MSRREILVYATRERLSPAYRRKLSGSSRNLLVEFLLKEGDGAGRARVRENFFGYQGREGSKNAEMIRTFYNETLKCGICGTLHQRLQ